MSGTATTSQVDKTESGVNRFRWRVVTMICVLLILFVALIPFVQTYRLRSQLEAYSGVVKTKPGVLLKLLPISREIILRAGIDESIFWSFDEIVGIYIYPPTFGKPDLLFRNHNDIKNLEDLTLITVPVGNTEMSFLARLQKLHTLTLSNTMVTDSDLVHLKEFFALKSIFLQEPEITDDGLEHLHGLKELKKVDLYYTKVTESGVIKLQLALPHCTIFCSPPVP